MSKDHDVVGRLAAISVLTSHGEATWKSEIAYQLFRDEVRIALEVPLPGRAPRSRDRVDLLIEGEAVEVKSSSWHYALKQKGVFAETDKWIGKDVRKLRRGTAPGCVVITIATLINAKHLAGGELSRVRTPEAERQTGRKQAIAYYQAYGHFINALDIQHVDLGLGSVPNNLGRVHLDALLMHVHDPVECGAHL
jgi:hypothetical protein